jgi:hypothetical protein
MNEIESQTVIQCVNARRKAVLPVPLYREGSKSDGIAVTA